MVLSDFLSRLEGYKSNSQEVNPMSFNSHSILTVHYCTFCKLPSETYEVVTRYQTKEVETQMPNVYWTVKVVDPALKLKTQARREGFMKPIPVIPKPVS